MDTNDNCDSREVWRLVAWSWYYPEEMNLQTLLKISVHNVKQSWNIHAGQVTLPTIRENSRIKL